MFSNDPFNRRSVRKIPVRPKKRHPQRHPSREDEEHTSKADSSSEIIEQLRTAFGRELAQAYRERDEWQQRYAALEQEVSGMRERLRRLAEDEAFREQIRTLEKMLEVADNLERALAAADEDPSALAEGVRLTYHELMRALRDLGVEPIEALGQPFDPALHHAAGLVTETEQPPGTVVTVERTGYTYRGKVLRPAMVYVAAESASEAS